MLAQFHRIRDDWGWLEVVANCLLGLAFLGSAAKNGLLKLTISGRDKAVVGCIVVGGVVGTNSAPLVLGEISELITVDWTSVLLIGEAVWVYFLMAFFVQDPDTARWGKGMLITVCGAMSVVVAMGGERTVVALNHYSRAVDAFAVGR